MKRKNIRLSIYLLLLATTVLVSNNINAQTSEINYDLKKNNDSSDESELESSKKVTYSPSLDGVVGNQTNVEDVVIGDDESQFKFVGGRLYVKGQNNYGQLGLNLSYTTNKDDFTIINGITGITSIKYVDNTLYAYVDSTTSYIVGKNTPSFSVPTYNKLNSNLVKNVKSNMFIKEVKTPSGTSLFQYFDINYNKVKNNFIYNATHIDFISYNTNKIIVKRINSYYSSDYATKVLTINYNSQRKMTTSQDIYSSKNKLTKIVNYKNINNKKKVTNQSNYTNGVRRGYISYAYNKKATYTTKINTYKYYSNSKLYSLTKDNYNSKKKKTYRWFATYNDITGKRNGVTKTWYNKKGKAYKIDATISNITYYSQKNSKYRNKMCKKAPYGGVIAENGCMLSSFAMINSIHGKKRNPGQLRDEGLDCHLDYSKAASKYGYVVQNTRAKSNRGYTRNVATSFSNSKALVNNNKKTYTLKDAITRHIPVQVWLTPQKRVHRGHSVVAYRYVYTKGKWDIKIYDPYTPRIPKRSLKDLSKRHYIVKAQVYKLNK